MSAVEAVRCAVAVQGELTQRNAGLSETRRMVLRIGINLGDVIEQDSALYGDGVSIAARRRWANRAAYASRAWSLTWLMASCR